MRSYGSAANYSIDLSSYQSALQNQTTTLQGQLTAQYNNSLQQLQTQVQALQALAQTQHDSLTQQSITQLSLSSTQGVDSIHSKLNESESQIIALTNQKLVDMQALIDAAEAERSEIQDAVTSAHTQLGILEEVVNQVQPYIDSIVETAELQAKQDVIEQAAISLQTVLDQKDGIVQDILTLKTSVLGDVQLAKSTAINSFQQVVQNGGTQIQDTISVGNQSITQLVNDGIAALGSAQTLNLADLNQAVTDGTNVATDLSNIIGQAIQSYTDIQNIVNQAEPHIDQIISAQEQASVAAIIVQQSQSQQAITTQEQSTVGQIQQLQQSVIGSISTQQSNSLDVLQSAQSQAITSINAAKDTGTAAITAQYNTSINSLIAAEQISVAAINTASDTDINNFNSIQTQAISSLNSEVQIGTQALQQTYTTLQSQLQGMINQINSSTSGGGSGLLVGTIVYTANADQWQNNNRWLPCNGQSFDETVFPQLYQFLGTNVLPNLTSQFIRCIDPNGGRNVLSTQQAQVGSHQHGINLTSNDGGLHQHSIPSLSATGSTSIEGSHTHRENGWTAGGVGGTSNVSTTNSDIVLYNQDGKECTGGKSLLPNTDPAGAHSHTVTVSTAISSTETEGLHSHTILGQTDLFGGSENIPQNVALYAIIKTDSS